MQYFLANKEKLLEIDLGANETKVTRTSKAISKD